MAFPSLKNILSTILLAGAIGFGCATSSEEETSLNKKEFPSDTRLVPIELTCPKILTESIPEGFVNEDYNAKIEADGNYLHYSLKNAPEYITIDNGGNINFKPNHIENRKLDVIVSNGSCSDEKELDLVVYPYLNPNDLKYYDYFDRIIDEKYLVAPTPAKDIFIETNFAYYDAEKIGIGEGITKQKELNGTDINPLYNPLMYHLSEDQTCKRSSKMEVGKLWGKNVCMFNYEMSMAGNLCINPEEPSIKPDVSSSTCLHPEYFKDPLDIKSQMLPIHETQHAINVTILTNPQISYPNISYAGSLDEQLSSVMSYLATNGGGYYSGLDSFCDFTSPPFHPTDVSYFTFWNGFCNWHSPKLGNNFDVDNLPTFFQTAKDIIDCKNYPLNHPLNLTELKCSLDAAVGDNTYDYFCSQSWDCNNVPNIDCGFIVKYLQDNNLCTQ